jgi:cytochrome c
MGGALPFTVQLIEGTMDPDGDTLKYSWKISSKNGYNKIINQPDAKLSFSKTGVYKATLTVKDGKGGVSVQSLELTAGNEPVIYIRYRQE